VDIYGQEYPLLTYIAAFPNSYTYSDSVLIVQINDDLFEHSIKSTIPYDGSASVVLDHESRIIYALNPAMKTVTDFIIGSLDFSHEDPLPVRRIVRGEDRKDYFLYLRASEENRLTYLSIIPYREFTRAVQKYTMFFFITILFIILIGSVLIFFLMRYKMSHLKNSSVIPVNISVYRRKNIPKYMISRLSGPPWTKSPVKTNPWFII
jgi:hypothetical protein